MLALVQTPPVALVPSQHTPAASDPSQHRLHLLSLAGSLLLAACNSSRMLTPRYCAQITTAVLTIPFSTNYTAEGGPTLKIDGWEPAEEGSYPVIIYMGASGLPHDVFVSFFVNLFGTFWEQEGGPAGLSETCGAIAAFVDFPDPLVLDGQVDDACELATTRAEAVFTKAGSALSTLCAMPKADCSKGVGIVGYTTGAVIGAVGANLLGLPYPITAMIIDQMGTEKTFAGSFSRMECMTNENIEPGLPKDKRLSVLSSTDSAIGTTTADTLRVQKEMSGYDCGDDFDCRQPNGAGYYLFDTESMLGPDKPIVIGHWGVWHMRGNAHYTFTGMSKWLYSQLSYDTPLPDVCKPGCEIQYALPPLSSRRLLFASQPAEPYQCLAPPAEFGGAFGSYLANDWYTQSYEAAAGADPYVADVLEAYLASNA